MPERFPPIAIEDLSPEQRRAAQALIATPRGEVRGPFIPLLYSPRLLDRVQELGGYLRYDCSLEKRLRETAILCVAANWRQGYEWKAHIVHAMEAGVAEETIRAIEAGRGVTGESPADEREIIAFCRELLQGGGVEDALFTAIVDRHGRQGAIELASLCGYYSLLAYVLNLSGIER